MALFALDEIEALEDVLNKRRLPGADVLNALRHLSEHCPHFKLLLASSHPPATFQSWRARLGNIQTIKIGYLEEDEARQLVEQPVKRFVLNYEIGASNKVLCLTRSHPHLIQLLCHELLPRAARPGRQMWKPPCRER
jgi:hypothetical protein